MIAMSMYCVRSALESLLTIRVVVVGISCLIAYVIFERYASPIPSFPRRILMNKTFMSEFAPILRSSAPTDLSVEQCASLSTSYLSLL